MKRLYYTILAMVLIMTCCTGCSRDSSKTVEELNDKAMTLLRQNRASDALKTITLAVKKAENKYGAESEQTATCLETMGLAYQAGGDSEKAESSYKRALSFLTKVHGKDNIEAAKVMNNLAGLYYAEKKYARAADFFKQSLAIVEKKFPADDPRLKGIQANLKASIIGKEGKVPEVSRVMTPKVLPDAIPDLVPQQIKHYTIENLAKQNILISQLQPEPAIKMGDKGMVFPYRCVKQVVSGNRMPVILLFAAVKNKNKRDAYIFQQVRIASYQSYKAKLKEGGVESLKKDLVKIFPDIFS